VGQIIKDLSDPTSNPSEEKIQSKRHLSQRKGPVFSSKRMQQQAEKGTGGPDPTSKGKKNIKKKKRERDMFARGGRWTGGKGKRAEVSGLRRRVAKEKNVHGG